MIIHIPHMNNNHDNDNTHQIIIIIHIIIIHIIIIIIIIMPESRPALAALTPGVRRTPGLVCEVGVCEFGDSTSADPRLSRDSFPLVTGSPYISRPTNY